jgi:hypothetical protein
MRKPRKAKKSLSARDFAGDGEPYTEIAVTISIRLLGSGITRSRLAVNLHLDPALQALAVKSLKQMRIENYGFNEHGAFGACLSEHFNGWEDMDKDYPRIAEEGLDEVRKRDAAAMNAYIKKSVDWAIQLHKYAMAEALLNDARPTQIQ